jgi:hypothetical protein
MDTIIDTQAYAYLQLYPFRTGDTLLGYMT